MKRIQSKLLIFILLPAAVLFIVSSFIVQSVSSKALIQYSETSVRTFIDKAGSDIGMKLKDSCQLLEDVRTTVEVLHSEPYKNRTLLPSLFLNYLEEYPDIFSLWIYFQPDGWDGNDAAFANTAEYDETGNYAVWAYREKGDGRSVVSMEAWGVEAYEEDYYAIPFSTSEFYMSAPYEEEITDDFSMKMISITRVVKSQRGDNIAVIGIDISLDFLNQQIQNIDEKSHGISTIAFHDGSIIADSDTESVNSNIADYYPQETLAAVKKSKMEGRIAVLETNSSRNDQEMIQMIKPITIGGSLPDWTYILNIPMALILEIPNRILRFMLIMVCTGVTLLMVIILFASHRISRPLVKLRDVFQEISSGDLRAEITINNQDETGQLAMGFNQLTTTLSDKLSSVTNSINQLQINSEDLSKNMAKTHSSFKRIAESITQVIMMSADNHRGIRTAEESVTFIRESILSLERNISIQDNMLQESSSAIEQVLANIHSISSVVNQSSTYYYDLKETSVKGEVLLSEVISEINKVTPVQNKIDS